MGQFRRQSTKDEAVYFLTQDGAVLTSDRPKRGSLTSYPGWGSSNVGPPKTRQFNFLPRMRQFSVVPERTIIS
ncbi:hypothetical protein BgiMline_006290 [Biomphalaria glabrata]|nr:hypothetical protein BgiMline_004251 [Biomphalaria glabrata]